MPIYSVVGTADTVICEEHLKPENSVEMISTNPDPSIYISTYDGTWVVKDYATARKADILKSWPIEKQLEALTEYLETPSRPKKMQELEEYIQQIKLKYPKPE